MKTIVGMMILAIAVSSCMNYHCHAYDGSKGHTASVASARKSKPAKNHTSFIKKVKFAEKD